MAVTNKVEVVISGIAGIFPECDNVEELKDLLFNKQNGVTLDSSRWPLDEYGITSGVGKVKCINKFDNVFFNIHGKLCECTETVIKMNLERSVEAIFDAGINPGDLYNTNTAVLVCSSGSETDSMAMFNEAKHGFAILGHNKSMQANRLSYSLNLNGPSFTILTSFTGGADVLIIAKSMIEMGHIRTAIITGCNLVHRPNISLQLKGLGILTDGVETRSFSNDADGFNRSDSCVSIILQNSLDAKRSYGTLMSVNMKQHGGLRGVFTNYSTEYCKQIIREAYEEAGVDPTTVAYIEADGSAIKDVDAMELDIMKEVFCPHSRKEPLKIGSIKSNLGHTDSISSLVSIIKGIIAMDTGFIPPNINCEVPNNKSDAIVSGKVQVVTEKTPLQGNIIGLNIFGKTGNYGHIILKRNNKLKKKIYAKDEMFDDELPRLILVSGRSDAGVRKTIKTIENYNIDEEYVSLLNNVFSKNIGSHFFRSSFIVPTPGPPREKDVFPITNEKPSIWFMFSGMGSQWLGMGTQLLKIPIFAEAIKKCDAVLKPIGINIFKILTSLDVHLFDNILNSFVGITAVQIGLVDILRALDIEPDGIIGHSLGELACSYADGCFTAEETILATYARGRATLDMKHESGMMAAVGLGYKSVKDRLPHDIDIACHNSANSCTLSGPTESVVMFVEKLKSENVFARTVNASNISFHSRYIKHIAPKLLKYMTELLPDPKPRSSKWISTSVPESEWNSDLARYSSAQYHANNMLSSVLFEEACVHIPKNAIVIEIAPHGLLQAIVKRAFPDMIHIPLTQRVFGDSIKFLLTAIGKMYCNGLNPNIEMLYEPISYPVSNGTPPLHTLCSWNHDEDWPLIDVSVLIKKNKGEQFISLSPAINSSIEEYEIQGHHILPLSVLLFYTWESFIQLDVETEINKPVVFQDIHYNQHVVISKNQSSELCTSIQAGTGRFELCLNNNIILSGYIFILDKLKFSTNSTVNKNNDNDSQIVSLEHNEVYSILEQFNYCVGDVFKTIKHVDIFKDELKSNVSWDGKWTHYIDAMLQLPTFYHMEIRGELVVPVSIQEICIDPAKVEDPGPEGFFAKYNTLTNEVTCTGIKISLPYFDILPLEPIKKSTLQLFEHGLVNLKDPKFDKPISFIDTCMNIILEFRHFDDLENVSMCSVYDGHDQTLENYAEHILETKGSKVGLVDVDPERINSGSENSQYVILTRGEKLLHTISLVANKNHVHLIVISNYPIPDNADYIVVIQQKFEGNYLSLIKKIKKIDNNFIIHKLNSENIDHPNYLKNELTGLNMLNKTIYIVSKTQPADGILPFVKKISEIKNKRFFFIFDNTAPDFSITNPFYTKQLAKDLLVNVYTNGKWVTYKEKEFINIINTRSSTRKTLLTNMSNASFKNISVKYIGLNLRNMGIQMKNNKVEHELGPIEYSGLTSDGSMVMGVAPYIPTIIEIVPDPILSWKIPNNMTFEEATTIPVPYSMAYYMLIEISKLNEEHKVLVHAGLTVVGKAAIDVCLEKKCQVFVTVSDSKQFNQLKQRFPTLPHSNILIYDKDNFEIKLLMANKKMNVIINCLDGYDFYASLRVIANHGKFFQLTKTDMKKNYKLGLNRFLKDITFFSVSMDKIIKEREDTKTNIQNLIQRRLNNGTIIPFDGYILSEACTRAEALQTFEQLSINNECKQVVIPISKDTNFGNVENQFQCDMDKVYFVIENETEDWLYLVEWLAQRGALKIVVALEKYYSLTPKISRRFNILMGRYKGITVQLVSTSLLNTEESAYNLLNNSTTSYPLAALFFVSSVDGKLIENMQRAVSKVIAKYEQKPLFACLFCGGVKPCEILKSAGVNAFCLSWSQIKQKPNFTKIIPLLDSMILKSETLTNTVVICSEFVSNKRINRKTIQSNNNNIFLPNTLDEMKNMSKYIVSNADFVEVATKSVLYADAKGTYPIFVVPGFRPNSLQCLYKNLGYPTFEARYPSKFDSIYSIADILVKKLKQITDHKAITLIGESWGGSVALIMAQMLESEGILVSLSLLNGVPNTLIDWLTKNVNQNKTMSVSLLSRYFPINAEVAEQLSSQQEWTTNLMNLLKSNKISSADSIFNILNTIQTQLETLIKLKPLPNKLLSIPQVFISSELSESKANALNDFCINSSVIHVIDKANISSMLEDEELSQTINENVAHYYPYTSEKSLVDKYNQYYYRTEVIMLC